MNETTRRGLIHYTLNTPNTLNTSTQDTPTYCIPDAEGHCITCSDEAMPFTVVSVDADCGLALVSVEENEKGGGGHAATEEIDITLVDDVVPGSVVLVHGGVAIALLTEANNE